MANRKITRELLDDMWERIEDLKLKLASDPDNQGVAALLQGLLDSYYVKMDQYREQEWKAGR
jgi:hypothetical protein